jgi:hypothetical protein
MLGPQPEIRPHASLVDEREIARDVAVETREAEPRLDQVQEDIRKEVVMAHRWGNPPQLRREIREAQPRLNRLREDIRMEAAESFRWSTPR